MGNALRRETDEQGICTLPRGEWAVEAPEGDLSPVPDRIDGRTRRSITVWVHRPREIGIVVTDDLGRPVESARVVWTPSLSWDPLGPEPWEWSPNIPRTETRTDARGRARMELAPATVGRLGVLHASYRPFRLDVTEPPESLEVQLHRAPSDGRVVTFVGADDLQPLGGVQVRSPMVGLVAESDDRGRARIPGAVLEEEELQLSGECMPLFVSGADLNAQEVSVARASRVAIRLVPPLGSGESAVLLPDWGDVGWKGIGWLDLPGHIDLDPPDLGIDVPVDHPVELNVVTSRGRSGVAPLVAASDEEEVQVRLSQTSVLDVRAVDPDGKPLDEFRVRCRFDEGSVVVEPGPERYARLPGADLIQRFSIHADGYASAYVRPERRASPSGPDHEPSGTVTIEMLRARSLELRVVDHDGRPLAGYLVEVSDRRMNEAFDRWRDLSGCWPTSHPAWVQSIEPSASGRRAQTTDHDGRLLLTGVAQGQYDLGARIHPRRVAGDGIVAPPPTGTTVTVPADGTVEIRARRVRPVLLRVTESATGGPVPSFRVSAKEGLGSPSPGSGGLWQGWVQAGSGLDVSAPGLRGSVPQEALEGSKVVEVTLEPDDPRTVVLEGDVEGLAGKELRLLVRRTAFPPAIAWRVSRIVEDPTRPIPFYAPFEDGILMTINDVVSGEHRWTFEPKTKSGERWLFSVRRSNVD